MIEYPDYYLSSISKKYEAADRLHRARLQKRRDNLKKACCRFEMGVEWRISASSRNEALVLMRSQLHRAVDLGSQHATEIHQTHALNKPRRSGNNRETETRRERGLEMKMKKSIRSRKCSIAYVVLLFFQRQTTFEERLTVHLFISLWLCPSHPSPIPPMPPLSFSAFRKRLYEH